MVGRYEPGTEDWHEPDDLDVTTIVIVDDDKPASFYLDKLRRFRDRLNETNIPYNPIGQNSNSSQREAVEAVGLTPPEEAPVWAPGYQQDLFADPAVDDEDEAKACRGTRIGNAKSGSIC